MSRYIKKYTDLFEEDVTKVTLTQMVRAINEKSFSTVNLNKGEEFDDRPKVSDNFSTNPEKDFFLPVAGIRTKVIRLVPYTEYFPVGYDVIEKYIKQYQFIYLPLYTEGGELKSYEVFTFHKGVFTKVTVK